MTTAVPRCVAEEARWAIAHCRPRQTRTLREYAEQEIIIPEGRYAGTRFRVHRQPFAGLYFDAVDSGKYNRFAATGCVQSGKTLDAVVIPALWHLDEHHETVVCGLPTMDIAQDKWQQEFLPVFQASPRLRGLLPKKGRGSRGGRLESITLTNGSTLKFMSGRGGDEKRSAFTTRCVVVTEADKMDEAGETSREADPITQLESRTASYGNDKRVYLECTTSIEQGRIWQEYTGGTESRIVCPCPHCGAFVAPGREHLVGWQDAETDIDAAEASTFVCPDCAAIIDDYERARMVESGQIIHRGQTIAQNGDIEGDPPKTRTLGFRWDAFDNLFWTSAFIGGGEWRAARDKDERNAERERRQFYWAVPIEPDEFDATPLDLHSVVRRRSDKPLPRGVLPVNTEHLTMGVDVGKHKLHWAVIAWEPECRGTFVDYGTVATYHNEMSLELAIIDALQRLNDSKIAPGWIRDGGSRMAPGWVFIDANYQPASVYEFTGRANAIARRFLPSSGYGGGNQPGFRKYTHPARPTKAIQHIGDYYHVRYDEKRRQWGARVDADYWKTWIRQRLICEAGLPGSLVFFEALAGEHSNFVRQLDSEDERHEEVPGRGLVTRWYNRTGRQNHWLDAAYLACTAGHLCGVRLVGPQIPATPAATKPRPKRTVTLPDGRPFLITER